MSFTIYSIGDVNFLAEIINSVAMLTAVPDFNKLIQIGLLIGVIFVMIQSVFQGAKQVNWHQVFLGWILYTAFFVPTTTVTLLDSYTSTARVVSNVPMVIGVAGGVISRIGYGVTRLFEQGYGNIDFTMTNRRFADSLQILNKVRRQGTDTRLFEALNKGASPGADMRKSWYNYMNECVMVKLALGDMTVEDMYAKNWQEAFKFQTKIFPTEIYTTGTPQTMLCGDAFTTLVAASQNSMNQPAFQTALNRVIGAKPDEMNSPNSRITNALHSMNAQQTAGAAMNQAHAYVLAAILEPLYLQAAAGHYRDMQDHASAMMVNQAIMQRNTQWAAEQTMFMSVVRPMVTFFEGFIYAITPVMAFLLVLGAVGIGLAGKYFLVLFWIQLWMPVLSIVNLFINTVAALRIGQLNSDGFGMTSMYALSTGSDILQNWIATGGMLAAATPIISLFIVTGSSYAFTHLAGRINGADHINERIASPDVAQPAPLIQQTAGYQLDPTMGFRTSGAENIANTYSTGAAAAASTKMFESQTMAAQKSVSQTLGGWAATSNGIDSSYSRINDITSRIGSVNTQGANLIKSKAMEAMNGVTVGHGKEAAVQSVIQSQLGGNLAFGIPMTKASVAAGLSAADSSLTGEKLNKLVNNVMNASKSLQFSDSKAELASSLVSNFTDKNSENFSSAWSSEQKEAFAKQATELTSAQKGWEKAQSYQKSMGQSHSYNDLHVGTGAANNKGAQKALNNWLKFNAKDEQKEQINSDKLRFQGEDYGMNAESALLAATHKTMYRAAQSGDENANSSLRDFQERMYGVQGFAPKPFSKDLQMPQAPDLPQSSLSQKVDAHVPVSGAIPNRSAEAEAAVAAGDAASRGYKGRVQGHYDANKAKLDGKQEEQMAAEHALRHEEDRKGLAEAAGNDKNWRNHNMQRLAGNFYSKQRREARHTRLMQESEKFQLTDAQRTAYSHAMEGTEASRVQGYNHLAASEYSNSIARDRAGRFLKNKDEEYVIQNEKVKQDLENIMTLFSKADADTSYNGMHLKPVEQYNVHRPGFY